MDMKNLDDAIAEEIQSEQNQSEIKLHNLMVDDYHKYLHRVLKGKGVEDY